MRSRTIKKITVAAVAFILLGQAMVLILFYSPDFLARAALKFMLQPDRSMKKLENQQAGRPETGVPLVSGTSALDPGAPTKTGASTGTAADTFSIALQEGKNKLDTPHYNYYSGIMNKYHGEFAALQVEYEQKLNYFISSATLEYRQDGRKNSFSLLKLAEKYIASGKALEADCDQQFYTTLAAMETELKAANLPTDAVEEAKKNYDLSKNARRQLLLNKAMEMLRS